MTIDQGALLETAEELYENAPCGYLSTLPNGTIVKANQTFLTWIGLDRKEIVGHRCFQDLLNIGGKIFYDTHFAPLLRMQGFVNEIAFDLTSADGRQLPVLANTVQKLDAAGKPLVHRITLFNATDRRKYERELLLARQKAEQATEELRRLNETLEERVTQEVAERMKAEEALRQAQKMEAVGQLTGGIAHDFNNLLTIIVGNIELMQRRLPEGNERLARAADHAMEATSRAATLTQRLLAFSRRQPLEPKPIDANKLVASMSELLRRTLGETVVLETVLAGGLWRTQADPNQLENAIVNLAVNARDAMPGGGKLTIETANTRLDEAYVEALSETVPPGQYVQVSVSDTGTGMDKATMDKVFEPFFTTKAAGKGTGLGLSQVYGFVRQSNGHVRIYSELGQGTTIKIYLPRLVGAEDEAAEAPVKRAAMTRGSGETILVVEDEPALRAYAVEALHDLGYRVLEAADGREALSVAEQHSEIALLFTDVVLTGGMNGRALADAITRHRPGLPVLYTTGYTANAIVHHGRLDPGMHLIGKPFTYAELAAKVRRMLDGA
ncbi:ATP-binding protein [Microvirga lotononidis]|uniref:histidine kinase n=1 Tax=Microvirga lotononidis TaxID=864069 RepID=I4YPW4_9HYPH|nr:ATP-binding protein [Microvirga lotononidis]EIM26006.1 PAS domain S-box [Microvirga lotononidis]WQO25915.1 ATP-binding protein [Microvirga lotononidis]